MKVLGLIAAVLGVVVVVLLARADDRGPVYQALPFRQRVGPTRVIVSEHRGSCLYVSIEHRDGSIESIEACRDRRLPSGSVALSCPIVGVAVGHLPSGPRGAGIRMPLRSGGVMRAALLRLRDGSVGFVIGSRWADFTGTIEFVDRDGRVISVSGRSPKKGARCHGFGFGPLYPFASRGARGA